MNSVFRRLRVVGGVSLAALVILAGGDRAVIGVAAGQSPGGTPSLKVLVTNESNLAVPDRLALGVEAINDAGDWVTAAGGGTALFLRHARTATLTRLLQSGDPVPGVSFSAIDVVNSVRINQAGVVCALVWLSRDITEYAILTHDGATLRKVVASSDIVVPGSSGAVFGRYLNLAGINDEGDVAFTAPMTPLGWPSTGPVHRTVFIAPGGGTPVRIVGQGDPAPETGGTLDQISGEQFNNRSEVLFRAAIVGGTAPGFGYFVAARNGAGGVVVRKVVATGDSDLRGGTFDAALATNGVQFNNAGQVALVISGRGLYVISPSVGLPNSGLVLITASGGSMPAPLTGRNQQSFATLQASFNDSGSVAFAVTVNGLAGSPNAVLRNTAGTVGLDVLAYSGQSAPDTDGQKFYSFSNVRMNNFGDVSFYSALAPNTPATGGLFKVSGGTVVPVVLDGQAAPSPPGGTYRNTAYSRLFNDGSVYFESFLSGGAQYGAFVVPTTSAVRVLASNADLLPAGSRVVMRNLFMGGAGNYTMFEVRRTGAGDSLWTHNVVTGVTSMVIAAGDQAPVSGGGVVSGVGASNQGLTRGGDVVFSGTVWGTAGTFLFWWSPTAGVSKLVGPGDSLPNTDLKFTSCSFANLLVPPFNQDMVVFRGNLNNGSNGIFLVRKSDGAVAKVVLSTDAAPGGGTFTGVPSSTTTLNHPYINGQGQVAFWGLTSEGTSGVFIGTAAGLMPVNVAATGDPAPGGGTFSAFALAGPAGFNDLGQVVFFATVAGGSGGGFFVGTADGPVQAIALNGTPAPGGGDFAFDGSTKDALANARGDILFKAPLAGGTAGSGLFLRRASTGIIETVALEGQPAPERPFPFGGFGVTMNNYPGETLALGPTGEVVFGVDVDLGDRFVFGLFRYNGPGTLETVFLRGEPAPGGGDSVIAYYSQKPGTGGEGLFFLALRIVSEHGGCFRDGIYLLDTMPPTLSVSANPTALWPANGKMRPVTISGLAADAGSGVAGTQGTYDVVDEYGLVQPAGTFTVGGSGTFSFEVPLEARRLGTDKDGRRYDVRVTVHDVCGNATTASVTIIVPFSQGK